MSFNRARTQAAFNGKEVQDLLISDLQERLTPKLAIGPLAPLVDLIITDLKGYILQRFRAHLAFPNFTFHHAIDAQFSPKTGTLSYQYIVTATQFPSEPRTITGSWSNTITLDPSIHGEAWRELPEKEISLEGGTMNSPNTPTGPGKKVDMMGIHQPPQDPTKPGPPTDHHGNPVSEGRRDLTKRRSIDYSANKDKLSSVGAIPAGASATDGAPKDSLASGIVLPSETETK